MSCAGEWRLWNNLSARLNRCGRSGRAPGGDRGIALIAVLWVVMLLAVIAGSLLMLTRTEIGLSRNLMQSAKARALAEGGVHLAIIGLLDPDRETRWKADGRIYKVEREDGLLEISVQDMAGLIDLNAAPPELLAGLFHAGGLEEDEAAALADRLVDWRDPDEEPRPNGAEQADYDAAGQDVRVGNRPFLTPDEIQRVPGVTMPLWARISPAVTVYSRRPGVNPATAPRLALQALPELDAAVIDALLEARTGDAATGGQRAAATAIPPGSRRFFGGSAANMFAIASTAQLPGGGVYVQEAIVELVRGADPPWRVHAWRPGAVYGEDLNNRPEG